MGIVDEDRIISGVNSDITVSVTLKKKKLITVSPLLGR